MEALAARVFAPAKVNLYLRILGRRTDGYHLLDSLLTPVSLYDQVHIGIYPNRTAPPVRQPITVTSDSDQASGGPTNLAHRAAALFLKVIGRPVAVDIHISKSIPVGSGLGGGSSDAAAVLLTLNRLMGAPYSLDHLAHIGAELGADVPFFVYGCPARIGGVGEQVRPLRRLPDLPLVICCDGFSLSTKLVYSRVDPSLTLAEPLSNMQHFVSGRKPISEMLVNDLETAAAQIHPEVLLLKARLLELGALGALMAGSGSAVFGVWADLETARNAAMRLREQGLWAEAVQTLKVSPAARS